MSEKINVEDVEDRKLKRKIEEEKEETDHFLSLRLCNNVDMSKPLKVSGYGFVQKGEEGREFGCKYCRKKFRSSQALGGHQNAHRRERVLCKMEKELCMGTFGHHHRHPHLCPCSSIIPNNNHLTNLPFPFRTTTTSVSPYNYHIHHHRPHTHLPYSSLSNWTHGCAHQGLPKPSLPLGMSSSWNANLVGNKPNSSSGLDLSLNL